ncbi:MAG: N-acetylmannosamine-6-phosphate 2-epimerase [Vampirovibrionales bacterium]|nr:N-acetylmannosamine-6-phosphate 2-epimerase [Vampirovibrionales bacterium]
MSLPWSKIKSLLKHQVIVSVQASKGEPLNRDDIIEALALSALSGGAAGLRMANTLEDDPIGYFKQRHAEVPVIGLTKPVEIPKDAYQSVYITPDTHAIDCLLRAQADVIAMDATQRQRPGEQTLAELVTHCRKSSQETPLMADVATLEEGLMAEALGFEMISTTLSGYTSETLSNANAGPDFQLLGNLVNRTNCPIVLEGRIWKPEEVKQAFDLGAFAVVIGSAITRPHHITQRFCASR